MNYIIEIKGFYDLLLTNKLSTGQIALWHALMHINNKCAWVEWFTVSNQTLELLTGTSRQAIVKNRNILKQKNILDFKINGTKATSYMLNSIQDGLQDSCLNSLQDSLQDSCRDSLPLNKLNINQTKRKIDTNVSKEISHEDIFSDRTFSDTMKDKLTEWFSYKSERKEPYKPTGLKSFLSQIENKLGEYDEADIISAIDNSMANNWKGIFYDKLTKSVDKRKGINLNDYIEKPKDNSFASIALELERKAHGSS